MIKKQTLIVLVLLFAGFMGFGQIVSWEMNGLAGSEVTFNATTNNANLNVSTLSRGSGLNPSSLGNAFSSTNYTASGTQADAITNNKYLQFQVSTSSGYQVSLSTLDVILEDQALGQMFLFGVTVSIALILRT